MRCWPACHTRHSHHCSGSSTPCRRSSTTRSCDGGRHGSSLARLKHEYNISSVCWSTWHWQEKLQPTSHSCYRTLNVQPFLSFQGHSLLTMRAATKPTIIYQVCRVEHTTISDVLLESNSVSTQVAFKTTFLWLRLNSKGPGPVLGLRP